MRLPRVRFMAWGLATVIATAAGVAVGATRVGDIGARTGNEVVGAVAGGVLGGVVGCGVLLGVVGVDVAGAIVTVLMVLVSGPGVDDTHGVAGMVLAFFWTCVILILRRPRSARVAKTTQYVTPEL
jgi:hypothetical protein